MDVSGERAWCLRQLILQKEFACRNCGSGSFIIKGAQWRMVSPPALDVGLNCANCGTGNTIPLTLEEARRSGFEDPN
jgi:RNase P subunit RPR2